jgi:signal transduction histidine kinase
VTTLDALSRLNEAYTRLAQAEPPVAPGVAQLLNSSLPDASLVACVIGSGEQSEFAVLDGQGRPDADWQDRLDPKNARNGTSLAEVWRHRLAEAGRGVLSDPASSFEGLLGVALPTDANKEDVQVARQFLDCVAQGLGENQTAASLQGEVESLERLANVGELAGLLVHEFTDFLNMLLLQLSVLEMRLPRDQHEDLMEVRRQGERVTALVGRFHSYRRGQPGRPGAVDLNKVVRRVVTRFEKEPEWTGKVKLEASALAPSVRGPESDVRRLVRFLVGNALRVGGSVRVATESSGKQLRLIVEDTGPAVSEADLPYVFHPTRDPRSGVDVLELAACRSLSRRLGGTIQAEALPSAGLRIVVSFVREEAP